MTAHVEEIAGIPLPADLDDTRPRAMVAVIDAKAGYADQLRKVIVELVRDVRQEPGCVTFVPYQQHSSPNRFYLYEVYTDLDAFKAHLRTRSGS